MIPHWGKKDDVSSLAYIPVSLMTAKCNHVLEKSRLYDKIFQSPKALLLNFILALQHIWLDFP